MELMVGQVLLVYQVAKVFQEKGVFQGNLVHQEQEESKAVQGYQDRMVEMVLTDFLEQMAKMGLLD